MERNVMDTGCTVILLATGEVELFSRQVGMISDFVNSQLADIVEPYALSAFLFPSSGPVAPIVETIHVESNGAAVTLVVVVEPGIQLYTRQRAELEQSIRDLVTNPATVLIAAAVAGAELTMILETVGSRPRNTRSYDHSDLVGDEFTVPGFFGPFGPDYATVEGFLNDPRLARLFENRDDAFVNTTSTPSNGPCGFCGGNHLTPDLPGTPYAGMEDVLRRLFESDLDDPFFGDARPNNPVGDNVDFATALAQTFGGPTSPYSTS